MQVTKDSYILSRNVIRVNNKTNKFYNFIKRNRFIIMRKSARYLIRELFCARQKLMS